MQAPAQFIIITSITPLLFQLMFLSSSSSGLNSQKNMLESNDFFTLWDFAPLIIRLLISCDQMLLFSHTYLCVLTVLCMQCNADTGWGQAQTGAFLGQFPIHSFTPNNWEINLVQHPFFGPVFGPVGTWGNLNLRLTDHQLTEVCLSNLDFWYFIVLYCSTMIIMPHNPAQFVMVILEHNIISHHFVDNWELKLHLQHSLKNRVSCQFPNCSLTEIHTAFGFDFPRCSTRCTQLYHANV